MSVLQDYSKLDSFEGEEIYIYGFEAQPIIQGFPYIYDRVTSIK